MTSAAESYSLGHRGRSVSPSPRAIAAAAMISAGLVASHVTALDATDLALLTLLYGVVSCGLTALWSGRGRPS
jgi:hypothetical protein